VRLSHSLVKTRVSFDDPNLVSHAGLVPVMALAQRAGRSSLCWDTMRTATLRPFGKWGSGAVSSAAR
jgi:hypothetical protein